MKKYQSVVLLLIILASAGFFRLYQLDSVPPGLHYDEGFNLRNAKETLETGQFEVFYPDNFGREGLHIWLVSLSFKIFGTQPWSLRLVSALIGILTVLGLYLLAKELFSQKVALISSFFLAVSFWHINFSRIGYRAILVPFILCFCFYFLLKAIRQNRLFYFIIAGIFFGLGFYTYIAFRLAVLLLGVVSLLAIWKHWQKEKLIRWGVFFITIILVSLPLVIYFTQNPEHFISRSSNISVFSAENPLKVLALSTAKSLAMFNIFGDSNWRHNYSGSPMLIWPVGILFILGIGLMVTKLYKPKQRIFLLSWFIIMLLPAILTFEGLPHALRSIGVIPVVYIFAALGLIWLFEKISSKNKKIAIIVLIFFLLYPALANYHKYFIKWANHPKVYSSFQ